MTTLAQERAEYAERLKRALQKVVRILSSWEEVERISVFGSFARGRLDLGTDLDLLVIMRTEEPFLQRLRRVYGSILLDVDADVLCYTPEEWKLMQETSFGRALQRQERVVYEKEST